MTDLATDEDRWLDWRKGGITATDVADAAQGTYGGAYGVVARKLGLITVEQNNAMRRGHIWQPRIADAVHALTGQFVVGEETWCVNSDNDMIRATIDGFLSPIDTADFDDVVGVLEVKTRGRGVRPNYDRHLDQMQWQMLATGLDVALLAEAVIEDTPDPEDSVLASLYLSEVQADPVRQEHLLGVAQRLWLHIEAGTLPDPDEASALDIVKRVWSDADPEAPEVDLTDLDHDIARLVQIKAAQKLVKDEHDQIEARIRNTVGEAKGGESERFRVSVSNPANVLTAEAEARLCKQYPELTVVTLDRTAFKSAHQDIYKASTSPVGSRRVTIKEKN